MIVTTVDKNSLEVKVPFCVLKKMYDLVLTKHQVFFDLQISRVEKKRRSHVGQNRRITEE